MIVGECWVPSKQASPYGAQLGCAWASQDGLAHVGPTWPHIGKTIWVCQGGALMCPTWAMHSQSKYFKVVMDVDPLAYFAQYLQNYTPKIGRSGGPVDNALDCWSRGPGFDPRGALEISETLCVSRLTRSLALVHPDGGQGASRVLVQYTGHVKEPRGLFEMS